MQQDKGRGKREREREKTEAGWARTAAKGCGMKAECSKVYMYQLTAVQRYLKSKSHIFVYINIDVQVETKAQGHHKYLFAFMK